MTKKKTAEQVVTSALIPVGSDINTPLEAKVTKAEVINILTVGIQQKLKVELDAAQLVFDKALLDIKQEEDNTIEEIVKQLKKTLTNESPIFWNNVQNRSQYGLKINILQHEGLVMLTLERGKGYQKIDIEGGFMGIGQHSVDYNIQKTNKDIIKAYESIEKARKVLNEIRDRYKAAADNKFIKAQLDLALLANTKNGQELVNNVNSKIDQLTETFFRKNDTKALPVN